VTLALALCGTDGIVLAADSQATLMTDGAWTRREVEKLYVLGGRIAWAGAGTVGAIQRVEYELRAWEDEITRAFAKSHELGAQHISQRVNDVQRKVASETIGKPSNSGSSYVFAGYGAAGQFILEFDVDGVREWSERNGFTAIGSGALYAVHDYQRHSHHALLSSNLVQLQALAYRTVENAISTAALGLGGAIRLAIVTRSGACLLDGKAIEAVKDTVDIWKRREVEIFAELGLPAVEQETVRSEPPAE
jgi:20S proteasome alpha/beta subunit